jgi:DNA-binding transcriptional MocR family regulator
MTLQNLRSIEQNSGLARRIERLEASPIREILHVIEQPGMVSFAGGLPSPDSFPDCTNLRVEKRCLQYGPSEGDADLRNRIANDLTERGLPTIATNVLILSGSQQGIDLVAKLLIDEGSQVAVESPTYLAALQVFSLFGARYLPFHANAVGTAFSNVIPQLLYTIPTFQNPSGDVYSLKDRKALAAVCDTMGTIVFEDDPYRDLAYEACERTPVCAFVNRSDWIYQSSFSKTLAPGLRLGYLTCSERLFPYLMRLKQAADLHSNRVAQQFVLALLNRSDTAQRLQNVVDGYRQKRDVFNESLEQYFSTLATWSVPRGGLFFWLSLNGEKPIDTRKLLPKAIEQRVAFMPGEPFFPDRRVTSNAIRLNFSHANPEQTEKGLATLANLVASAL